MAVDLIWTIQSYLTWQISNEFTTFGQRCYNYEAILKTTTDIKK